MMVVSLVPSEAGDNFHLNILPRIKKFGGWDVGSKGVARIRLGGGARTSPRSPLATPLVE